MPDTYVAYVHENEASYSWQESMRTLHEWDATHQQRLFGFLAETCGTDGLVGARNMVIRNFLTDTDAEWLFWIDSDMGFEPDIIDRLHAAADAATRPIMGALTFANRSLGPDGFNGYRKSPVPVIYDPVRTPDGDTAFLPRGGYDRDAVVACGAVGSAAVLIHRDVFVKIAEKFGPTWYDKIRLSPDTLTKGGRVISEDLSFSVRAYEVGAPVHVHTGVKTTHHKEVWIGEDSFLAASWPAPATERCAVIVPVLHRPQNVEPFMASLKASTSLATAYFVCEPDDKVEQDEVRKHGGKVLLHPGSFAKKVNHAYSQTTEPWLCLVGDDVVFRPGWLDRALRAAGDRFHLIGTNDLSQMQRDLACHPVIRRSWVEEHGASWDGPGVVCHDGYGHCFVDNEWTLVAKQAGAFISAPDAVIEHFHPIFDKAAPDAIYEKGYSTYQADERLFNERCAASASVGSYDRQWDTVDGMVKVAEDLDRYRKIIDATRPDVIVECGTWSGRSAAFFADLGPDVITVDVEDNRRFDHDDVSFVLGSSTDPDVVDKVTELVDGRRCMVVLDSDHSAAHVADELAAYSGLVTPGCYLVVEDGIVTDVPTVRDDFADGGPRKAVRDWLTDDFIIDKRLEHLHPVTHHPDGWLLRRPEVVDVFLYNGETDMAALRVATLAPHVDRMVAVACDLTHQGDPNPIPDAPDGCELKVVNAKPIPGGDRGGQGSPHYQWVERQHRDFTLGGGAAVLMSDVDEIPDPATLDDIICAAVAGPCAVPMRMHGFALDWLYPSTWVGTTASVAWRMRPQEQRDARYRLPMAGKGFHLSWMGSSDERQQKLDSFSHAELRDELDVNEAHRSGVHANGEVMARIDPADLDWPAPLFDSFTPPETWRVPQLQER